MDIDNHVSSIVQTIISQITAQVQTQVATQIDAKISEIISTLDTTTVLASQLSNKLDAKINQLPIDTKSIEAQLLSRLDNLSGIISAQVEKKATEATVQLVAQQVNSINFSSICQEALGQSLKNQSFTYLESSIPVSAINFVSGVISGDSINGGIIANFGSTGIDDKANTCQLSIFDDVTVVENNLLTKDLTVKGTVTIEGDLNVTGTLSETSPLYVSIVNSATNNVRTSLDETVFKSYSDLVFTKIKEVGLDLSKISLDGVEIVNGSSLSNSIVNSNLQKVGQLKELQVQGETLLSGTLYTTIQRVGVNTIEPSQALSVWDQEIEIGFGKQSTNTAIIGTPRNQNLIISSNGKNNLTVNPDGSTSVKELHLGSTTLKASGAPPSDDQPTGTIIFNSNPTLGGPLGWISLGDAKWANFGFID